ncbi:MAG: YraN family protein [Candidatus Hydrogenedentales bacterium]|jgi:putative endonuclease
MNWWPWRWTRSLGRRGEDLAARFLRRQGYSILGRNVCFGRYEIDIIAETEDTVAFVEVKTRSSDDLVDPEENVGYLKQRHIRRAAWQYIDKRDDPDLYYRFDVIAVLIPENGKPNIRHIPDAFGDE